ncbi:hypothetical protein F5Y04DRAFT_115452 [Hypomontagnella monticulosa]|nr:hypothetical protein F5Y04DRAFT_115452 [Hypomontagnella monticulosa]
MADSSIDEPIANVACIKKLKEAAAKSPQISHVDHSILNPPEPKHRETPANVRRREDRTIRAEPPPPPTSHTRHSPEKRGNGRRRKQGNGFNEGSDSDSDEHDPKRSHDGDTSIARRRSVQPAATDSHEPVMAGASTSASLTPEEEERIRMRRALKDNVVEWKTVLNVHSANRKEAEEIKKALILIEGRESEMGEWYQLDKRERRPPTRNIQDSGTLMDDYLNEALFCDTMVSQGPIVSMLSEDDLLLQVLGRIESDFILRWENQWLSAGQAAPQHVDNIDNRLIPTLKSIYEYMLDIPIEDSLEYNLFQQYAEDDDECDDEYVELFEAVIALTDSSTYRYNPAATIYERVIIRNLALDAVKNRTGTTKERQVEPFSIGQRRFYRKWTKRSRINWIRSFMPAHAVDTCCQQRYMQLEGGKIRSAQKSRFKQEFCVNADGSISLLLMDEERLVTIRNVDLREFHGLGWFEDNGCSMGYCRYEYDDHYGVVFKVTMDGKVLALARKDGCLYLPEGYSRLVGESESAMLD